ncbi:MAG: MBOAT family protein [Lachnospiraceae bacterium]|nr:MBOAT family protein [Lachnospiraceae bacterium]
MIFNSVSYLIFFPIAAAVYFILPGKVQNYWLLAASFIFYMNWNPVYALLLLSSIVITYISAIIMEKGICPKAVLALCVIANIGMLVVFKYTAFIAQSTNTLLSFFTQRRFSIPDIVLPVGISFYVFQALGYAIDVYRKNIKAERRFFRYALFVSFFPQLVAGPIERSKNLLPQFDKEHRFDADRVRKGLLIMLWGLFVKIVIADRIALMVTDVYDNYLSCSGSQIFLAALLFTLQIYCDFAGYSYIAIASAYILGFKLMDNFHTPLLSVSLRQFWKRWHISLTTWFTDYLYIPLGGNRKGKFKKWRNVLIVFFVSGLWHGASWTYVLWGVLNGLLLVAGQMTEGSFSRITKALQVNDESLSYRVLGRIWTYLVTSLLFFVFRAETLSQAVGMLRQAKALPQLSGLFGASVQRLADAGGLDAGALAAFIAAVVLLTIVDSLQYKNRDVAALVLSQGKVLRWMVYLGILAMIMIFGVYGNEYAQTQFIYFQF